MVKSNRKTLGFCVLGLFWGNNFLANSFSPKRELGGKGVKVEKKIEKKNKNDRKLAKEIASRKKKVKDNRNKIENISHLDDNKNDDLKYQKYLLNNKNEELQKEIDITKKEGLGGLKKINEIKKYKGILSCKINDKEKLLGQYRQRVLLLKEKIKKIDSIDLDVLAIKEKKLEEVLNFSFEDKKSFAVEKNKEKIKLINEKINKLKSKIDIFLKEINSCERHLEKIEEEKNKIEKHKNKSQIIKLNHKKNIFENKITSFKKKINEYENLVNKENEKILVLQRDSINLPNFSFESGKAFLDFYKNKYISRLNSLNDLISRLEKDIAFLKEKKSNIASLSLENLKEINDKFSKEKEVVAEKENIDVSLLRMDEKINKILKYNAKMNSLVLLYGGKKFEGHIDNVPSLNDFTLLLNDSFEKKKNADISFIKLKIENLMRKRNTYEAKITGLMNEKNKNKKEKILKVLNNNILDIKEKIKNMKKTIDDLSLIKNPALLKAKNIKIGTSLKKVNPFYFSFYLSIEKIKLLLFESSTLMNNYSSYEQENGDSDLIPNEKKEFDFITASGLLKAKKSELIVSGSLVSPEGQKIVSSSFDSSLASTFIIDFDKKYEDKAFKKIKFDVKATLLDDFCFRDLLEEEWKNIKAKLWKGFSLENIIVKYRFCNTSICKIGISCGFYNTPFFIVKDFKRFFVNPVDLKIKKLKLHFSLGLETFADETWFWSEDKSLENLILVPKIFWPLSKKKREIEDGLRKIVARLNGTISCLVYDLRFTFSKFFGFIGNVKMENRKFCKLFNIKAYYGSGCFFSNFIKIQEMSVDWKIFQPALLGFLVSYKHNWAVFKLVKLFGFEELQSKISLNLERVSIGKNDPEKNKKSFFSFSLEPFKVRFNKKVFSFLSKFSFSVFKGSFSWIPNIKEGIKSPMNENPNEYYFYTIENWYNKHLGEAKLFFLKIKYFVLPGLTIDCNLLNFVLKGKPEKQENKDAVLEEPAENKGKLYWTPTIKVKFDVANFLVEKNKNKKLTI